MKKFVAKLNAGIVERVIVLPADVDPSWAAERLGGEWVETTDEDTQQQYAGIGMGYDPNAIAKFALPWVQPIPGLTPSYQAGQWVWHDGRLWQSVANDNVWTPGEFGWRDHTEGNIPTWVQPSGAGDQFRLGDEVAWRGKIWRSNNDANVWEPGADGIGSDIWEDITESPPSEGREPWVQPQGGHDAYQIGDEVTHDGQDWVSTTANNVWEPGVFGWSVIT
jgi:hypothetical protein